MRKDRTKPGMIILSFQVEEGLKERLVEIAEMETRNMSDQARYFIKKGIERWDEEHG